VNRTRRIDVRSILMDERLRRELMVDVIVATQAREGIETTREQAERAYDAIRTERSSGR
jgi:hypothetical protein